MELHIILFLLIGGCAAGFIAGLLGVGGGLIVVPMTLWVLSLQGLSPENAQHIAIGTSFGVMVFTTFMGVVAQHRRKAIDWQTVKAMLIGTAVGTLSGATIAGYIPSKPLQIFFIVFCYAIAIKTFFYRQPKAVRTLPSTLGLAGMGSGVGLISSLLGIGGGVLNVPFLLFCSVPIKNAVGVSAAITFFIGLFGFVGYAFSGWSADSLPPYSLGYCNLPMMASFAATAMIFAPLGVKVSHRLSESMLKKCFVTLVLTVATKMLWEWLQS